MKYRLSTLLLWLSVIGLSAGLIAERQSSFRKDQEFAVKLNQTVVGTRCVAMAVRTIELIQRRSNSTKSYDASLDDMLCKDVWHAWKHETAVNEAFKQNSNDFLASDFVGNALDILNCSNVDSFFVRIQTVEPFTDHNNFPEIHDSNSQRFASFSNFISRSLSR